MATYMEIFRRRQFVKRVERASYFSASFMAADPINTLPREGLERAIDEGAIKAGLLALGEAYVESVYASANSPTKLEATNLESLMKTIEATVRYNLPRFEKDKAYMAAVEENPGLRIIRRVPMSSPAKTY